MEGAKISGGGGGALEEKIRACIPGPALKNYE